MEDIRNNLNDLKKLHEMIFEYASSYEDDYQDLTDKFNKLYKTNPEIYDIVSEIYMQLRTKNQTERKKLNKILKLAAEIKQNGIIKQKEQQLNLKKLENTFKKQKIPLYKTKKFWMSLGGIFLFLLFILMITENFFPKTHNEIVNAFKSFFEAIKVFLPKFIKTVLF